MTRYFGPFKRIAERQDGHSGLHMLLHVVRDSRSAGVMFCYCATHELAGRIQYVSDEPVPVPARAVLLRRAIDCVKADCHLMTYRRCNVTEITADGYAVETD